MKGSRSKHRTKNYEGSRQIYIVESVPFIRVQRRGSTAGNHDTAFSRIGG